MASTHASNAATLSRRAQLWLGVKFPDMIAACADHVTGQITLAVEIVRDLRTADGGRTAHLVDAGAADPALEHESGGHVDDAGAGRPALAGQPDVASSATVLARRSCARRRRGTRAARGPVHRVIGEHPQVVDGESDSVGMRPIRL